MSKQRQKGTAAETAVVQYLQSFGYKAMRNPLHGTKDKGDIHIDNIPVVIEVKNCAKMELSQWIQEAETERANARADSAVVWHKKRGKSSPGDWYVTMSGETFIGYLDKIETIENLYT